MTAQFGLVELDLLASYAGSELPFPLQVPTFGRVPPERDLLYSAAGETLQLRGFADQDGPLDLADRLVALLGRRRGTVDLVIGGPDWESGAVALVDSGAALLCLQRFNPDEHHLVDTYEVAADELAEELYDLVPEVPGGHSIPLRLPLRTMRAAHQVLTTADRDAEPKAVERRVYEVLRSGGVDASAADKLVNLLYPLDGYGQMGVTRPGRGGEDVRVGSELSWIDTPTGRYRVDAAGGRGNGDRGDNDDDRGTGVDLDPGGWMSINPLHPDELFSLLRGFVATVRR